MRGEAGRGSDQKRQPSDQALCPPPPSQMGRKSVKSVLWVSADGLRVVDDKTKVGGLWGVGGGTSGPLSNPLLELGVRTPSHPPPGCPSLPGLLDCVLLQHLGTPRSHNSEVRPAVIMSWHR